MDTKYTQAEFDAAVEAAQLQGWQDCLRQVRGSVEGYPYHGGDIEIMTAIDRIVKSALAQ